ncbi:molybdopterin-synthase adenylyltransferase MoeB [uncultured Azohydromonas sp.]|jgi:Dinucleotide-utilizing enzymes involved in molybdopterin and thiamine biosynthesis family 2|uniref:molybdopterin-synthase adenylyltransferase MoeB n=1 Tax=uncultured Azohydromonas sp. TaxID=487342 RepID=UPI002601FDA1|nr:molybdopterin-synthase adenylyltransferase MoeB [uncultured Azohydromonas sp.]
MSTVHVRIPMPLRGCTGGADEVEVQAATVGEALHALVGRHASLSPRLLSPEGTLRPFVNVFVGDRDVRALRGLDTPLSEGDVLAVIPAVAGGSAQEVLAELKARIPEIAPREALAQQARGALLVDVREPDEIAQGTAPGALRLGRSFLELRIERAAPDPRQPLILMCGSGARSLFAAADLARLGYASVCSLAGGFTRWKGEGLPVEVPPTLDAAARERYSRHLLMPEVGEAGQVKLQASKVLLVGAGGLGSPAAYYLAAAGVGTLGIVDHDVVDRSNLQRQILHNDARVGTSKVASARQTLEALNPTVKVVGHEEHLSSANVERIFGGYQLVVDGCDNFATRYLVNDACVRLKLPNVHGSVYRFEGQVSVFWPARPQRPGPCYRCLYPEPPPPEYAPSCAEAGVLGVLPGVIGLLQATEALKILLGVGEPLVGRLLYFDALRASFSTLQLQRDPDCRYCGEGRAFPGYVDYERFCASAAA